MYSTMSLRFIALSGLLAFSNLVRADDQGVEVTAESPVKGTDTVHGCYGNVDNLVLNGTDEFNTQGSCSTACRGISKAVGASYSSDCYCGDEYPPLNTLLDDSDCNEPCPGYGTQACGGINAWTVYNTGEKVSVANTDNITESSSSSSASSTTSQAVMTSAGVVITVTPTSEASNDSDSSSKTVGIAVGTVVGVLGVAAIAGALIFITRRRRNREIEEEHRRNAAVNAFISGGKPPSSSGGMSISDQRLDPVMAQRRMSSGSIADEADYSRRILRVTNA